ncbi:hypothetical protein TSAR_014975 [Trichomalopsis sarcophagae]|uniref:Endonuclease/exonuclease/phosphatase domain-containing protein n=1 Tax=Trichomalopsis sarcophagae TaxID=543379 RepID=A0A232EIL9_9HYME|nr:hypothetical protein TSAR_014975 [Trichomalopsis sarcophagae]
MDTLIQKNLKILFWNSKSIVNKKEELRKILTALDIFICVQSWLSKNDNFIFAGFKTFRQDRQDKIRGGIVILIRNHLAYNETQNISSSLPSIVIAGITITNVKPALDLLVCYRAPGVTISETQWDQVLNFNSHHINWNCNKTDSNGENFYNSLLKTNLILHNNNTHTYEQTQNDYSSNIDLIFSSNNLTHRVNANVLLDPWGSDHFPIDIEVDLEKYVYRKRSFKLKSVGTKWDLQVLVSRP